MLVESGRSLFGDRWAFCVLANTAAGIRSKEETCEDASMLSAQNVALCRRARYARLRAGSASWWKSQLAPMTDQMDLAFALLILVTWAGPTVFQKLARLVDEKLRILDADWWMKLSLAVQSTAYSFGQDKRDIKVDLEAFPRTLSERAIVAISSRVNEHAAEELFQKHLRSYDGEDTSILEFCQRMALYSAQRKPETWKDWLPIISHSYTKGAISDRYFSYRFANAIHSQHLPRKIAEEIVEHYDIYPTELVGWAEQTCRGHVAEEILPVGTVAERQNWFKS